MVKVIYLICEWSHECRCNMYSAFYCYIESNQKTLATMSQNDLSSYTCPMDRYVRLSCESNLIRRLKLTIFIAIVRLLLDGNGNKFWVWKWQFYTMSIVQRINCKCQFWSNLASTKERLSRNINRLNICWVNSRIVQIIFKVRTSKFSVYRT